MSWHAFFAVAALLPLFAAPAYAGPTTMFGSYTATDSVTGPYAPGINNDGGPFLSSPFMESLTTGVTTTPTTFLQVAPVPGGSGVGTQTGSIDIAMTLLGPLGSQVTSVQTSAGGNGATLSGGTINFMANYELFYGNQTDCLTWDSKTCTANGNTTTISETLTVTFADKAILNINLYNWSDWNMAPLISFDLVSDGMSVPEPSSLAIFGCAIAALATMQRARRSTRVS